MTHCIFQSSPVSYFGSREPTLVDEENQSLSFDFPRRQSDIFSYDPKFTCPEEEDEAKRFRYCTAGRVANNLFNNRSNFRRKYLLIQRLPRCVRRGYRRQRGVSRTGQRLRGVKGPRGVESSGGAVTARCDSSGAGKASVPVGVHQGHGKARRSPILRPPNTCNAFAVDRSFLALFMVVPLHCRTALQKKLHVKTVRFHLHTANISRCICCPCTHVSKGGA